MNKAFTLVFLVCASFFSIACVDNDDLEERVSKVEVSLTKLEQSISQANGNTIALSKIFREKILIVDLQDTKDGYNLSLSDGSEVTIVYGEENPPITPIIGVDKEGRWIISIDHGETFTPIDGSTNLNEGKGNTPKIKIDEKGYWLLSLDGKKWNHITNDLGKPISAVDGAEVAGKSSFFKDVSYDKENQQVTFVLLNDEKVVVDVVDNFYMKVKGYKENTNIHKGETLFYSTELSDVKDVCIDAEAGWNVVLEDNELQVTAPSSLTEKAKGQVQIILVSTKGYLRTEILKFNYLPVEASNSNCKIWNDFVEQNDENILLDYSYAGYKHGEVAPPDASTLGYKVYNVVDYGAVPNDGKSDREAFLKAYKEILNGSVQNPHARAIIYFPEGEYILHTSADDVNGKSKPIHLRVGDFVLKGAGKDKTTIVMKDPNLPNSAALYSSPALIEIKHYSGLSELTKVVSDAAKGSHKIKVASAAGLSVGDWVCLHLKNNAPELIAQELAPYSVEPGMTDLKEDGVKVFDYHQIEKIDGNEITFVEPIMHKVEQKWNWKIMKYPHYENVGVEDLTFKGNAKDNFVHHGSWQDDGAYKLINLTRIVNGWMRRVRFESVSEASSITNCANVSVFDVLIGGKRGHSAIRSQGSSRVFIGKVIDKSSGVDEKGQYIDGIGQFHGVGVSKPSMGTVLWRNTWGLGSCFESHATQPRATLIDKCSGGWMKGKQGGDDRQVPNHLADLTLWNFQSLTPYPTIWDWWSGDRWFKFTRPIFVGFHGEACSFDESQMIVNYSYGQEVDIESLYEAQLQRRLGYIPAWLNSLK